MMVELCDFCTCCFHKEPKTQEPKPGGTKTARMIKFYGVWACCFQSMPKTQELEPGGSKTARMGQVMFGPVASRDCRKHMNLIKFCCFCACCFQSEPEPQELEPEGSKTAKMDQALCLLIVVSIASRKCRKLNRKAQGQQG